MTMGPIRNNHFVINFGSGVARGATGQNIKNFIIKKIKEIFFDFSVTHIFGDCNNPSNSLSLLDLESLSYPRFDLFFLGVNSQIGVYEIYFLRFSDFSL